ncbi:hypothetical protein [Streptomyces wedmorensis]
MALADALSERPGRCRPSPAGRPASEAEPLGTGASLGPALGPALGLAGEPEAEPAPVRVPVGAGAGETGFPDPPVRPGVAVAVPVPVPGPLVGGVPEVTEEEGETDGADGVVPVGAGVGAVALTDVRGGSAGLAMGAAYRAHAPTNAQVNAGRRARARVLRSAGVTG